MSTSTPTTVPANYEPSVVLNDVSWDEYRAILAARRERRFHHTYDNGVLEIMSPSRKHEREKKFLARIIESIAEGIGIDIECLGNATHSREDLLKGLEPDECYYIANEPLIRDHVEDIDLMVDPPPDLVVEVDVTSSSLDRQSIYAALGVPEIWRFDHGRLSIYLLGRDSRYVVSEISGAFPFLTASKLSQALTEDSSRTRSQQIREVVAWALERYGKKL